MAAISGMNGRVPLIISGDMHAIALGKMLRSGTLDLSRNPVNVALSGTMGTRPTGWPSNGIRGTVLQMGRQDSASRSDRCARAIPHSGAGACGIGFKRRCLAPCNS
jgi:hypothetical protein